MTIEEEIARALAEWRSGEHAEPWEVDMYTGAAAALSPLLNRVRAEALREVAVVIDAFSGTCLNASSAADIITATADRIEQGDEFMSGPSEAARQHLQEWRATREQNSEGNET